MTFKTAEDLGHWVTDTGHCAPGCPICQKNRKILDHAEAIVDILKDAIEGKKEE